MSSGLQLNPLKEASNVAQTVVDDVPALRHGRGASGRSGHAEPGAGRHLLQLPRAAWRVHRSHSLTGRAHLGVDRGDHGGIQDGQTHWHHHAADRQGLHR